MIDSRLLNILPLTPEQSPPLSLEGKNLLISAGAGSGKTRVLIAHFANLVLSGKVKTGEILAITFTEKAASEMKTRLVRDIFSKIPGAESLRREVEEAYISTIHSFASRLLKEYALEIGVDPEFQVIAEDEKAALEEEVWARLLAEEGMSEDIYPLLLRFELPSKLKEELLDLRAKILGSGLLSFEQLDPAAAHMKDRAEAIARFLESALTQMKSQDKKTPGKIKALEAVEMGLGELKCFLKNESADLKNFEEAFSFRLPNADPDKENLVRSRTELKEAFLLAKDAETALERERVRKLLVNLDERLDREKASRRLLDYDDLLNKLLAFLRREDPLALGIQASLRKKFRFILMDELQDSNAVEAEIIRRLSSGNNLFLVGDSKQSIYAFRQADVEIFTGLEQKARAGEEDSQLFELNDNYRSTPEILEFVNRFFGELIFKDSPIIFSPLCVPASRPQPAESQIPKIECLAALDPAAERALPKGRRQAWEAEAIAKRIRELKETVMPDLKFGEVAILLKNFTSVGVYERALRTQGIPYSVVAGRGFYQKIEILDIVNFLEIIHDPRKDVPLAAVLRSPLVSFSDDGLLLLAEKRAGLSPNPDEPLPLWTALECEETSEDLSAEDRRKLVSFLVLRRRLETRKNQMTIAQLVREIVRLTHYDTKALLELDGKRKFANLEKLAEMAREFDSRNLSLSTFLGHLAEMTVKEVRESEAQADSRDLENVQIMTVHKAKGLEFRVVVAANFDGEGRKDFSELNFSKEWGLGIRTYEGALGEKDLADFRFLKNSEAAKYRRLEEAKRLFYVACTRARERLILTTAPAFTSAGNLSDKTNYFFTKILELLGLALAPECLEEKTHNGVAFRLVRSGEEEVDQLTSLLERPAFLKTLTKPSPQTGALEEKWEKIFSEITREHRPGYPAVQVPVTALLEFMECPMKYFMKYDLGLPEGALESVEPEEDMNEEDDDENVKKELPANVYGTLFHEILENWDFVKNSFEEYEKQKSAMPLWLPQDSKTRLEKELYLFAASPLAEKLRKTRRLERELNFDWEVARHLMLRGTIDLLFEDEKGEWHLVDYKTNSISSAEEQKARVEYYRPQLLSYGAVLLKVLGLVSLNCSLYFSRTGEMSSWQLDKKEAKTFESTILKNLRAITEKKFTKSKKAPCPACRFIDLCRAYKPDNVRHAV